MTTPSDASQAVELPDFSDLHEAITQYGQTPPSAEKGRKRAVILASVRLMLDDHAAAAIAQDRAARAQAEPVAWIDPDTLARLTPGGMVTATLTGKNTNRFTLPIYTEPAARAQGAGEAVAERCKECGGIDIPWGLGKCCCPKIMKGRDDREHNGADAQGAAQGGRTDTGGSGEGAGPGANVGDEHRSAEAEAVGHSDYSLGDSVRLPDARAIQEAIDLTPEIEARPVGGFTPQWSAAPAIPQAAEVPGFVLVPREPTIRQLASMGPAIRACYKLDGVDGNVRDVYTTMISAAPQVAHPQPLAASEAEPERAAVKVEDGVIVWSKLPKGFDGLLYAAPTPTASASKAEGEAVKLPLCSYKCEAFPECGCATDRTREGGDVVAKSCDTCLHASKPADSYPCRSCGFWNGGEPFDKWEAKPQPKFYTGEQES